MDKQIKEVIDSMKSATNDLTSEQAIAALESDAEGEPEIVGAIFDQDEVTKFLQWLTDPRRRNQ